MSHFLRLLTYVRRTIFRARLRSSLTVLGTALALGLFAFVWALERGVERLEEKADQPLLVVFQTSRFCPLTSNLPVRYADEISGMKGVKQVLPTLLYINACRSNLDLVTLHGVPTHNLTDIHQLEFLAGSVDRWRKSPRGAIVGQRLAQRRNLSIGDRVQLTNVDVSIEGIVTSDTAGIDNLAFVRLEQLQNARKKRGLATQVLVELEPGADPVAVAEAIDTRYRDERAATDTKSMQAFVQGAIGEVGEVVDFARLLGYLAVGIVVLILANTVSISAQTRTTELAVMETIGASRRLLGSLVLVESIFLALLGGLLGVGAVAIWLHTTSLTLGIEGWGIDIAPDATLAVAGVVVALGVGVVSALLPAWHTARRDLALAVKPE